MMQTEPTPKPTRTRTRTRCPSQERAVTIWVPAELLAALDRHVETQQAQLPPGARLTRHALVLDAVRRLVSNT
jgi:hypothetical protein